MLPFAPGFNETPPAIRPIAAYVARLGIRELQLFPYHRLGESKYRLLGHPVGFEGASRLSEVTLETLRATVPTAGPTIHVGG